MSGQEKAASIARSASPLRGSDDLLAHPHADALPYLLGSAPFAMCPGSGRKAQLGTGRLICPVCHATKAAGLPAGIRHQRKDVIVPSHPARQPKSSDDRCVVTKDAILIEACTFIIDGDSLSAEAAVSVMTDDERADLINALDDLRGLVERVEKAQANL